VGARPAHVFMLLCIESALLTLAGIALGLLAHYILTGFGSLFLQEQYGIAVSLSLPSATEWKILLAVAVAGLLAGAVPAAQAYRKSLSDGLAQRL